MKLFASIIVGCMVCLIAISPANAKTYYSESIFSKNVECIDSPGAAYIKQENGEFIVYPQKIEKTATTYREIVYICHPTEHVVVKQIMTVTEKDSTPPSIAITAVSKETFFPPGGPQVMWKADLEAIDSESSIEEMKGCWKPLHEEVAWLCTTYWFPWSIDPVISTSFGNGGLNTYEGIEFFAIVKDTFGNTSKTETIVILK